MKRTFSILAALTALALAPPAFAQVGIKGGLSWNNVSNSGLLPGELERYTGWSLGLGIGTTGSPISVGLEGLYSQRGLRSDTPANDVEFHYIDVPAYVRLAIPTEAVALFAYAGPQVSFEISCEVGGDTCDPNRETVGYAAVAGAGFRLGTQGSFTLEGRYVYGLSDLSWSTVTDENSYRTRSFMILAGLGF